MSRDLAVVITTYNYAQYLPEAVDSVLHQSTAASFEIVVVDDGSTDDTPAVMAQYADDGRVRYMCQENAGESAALNNGIASTASDSIMFLDGDDALLARTIHEA
ncbi:MAG: glycosyltransferase, partial [Candidatus Eisenbacteria sp.]|nr:glycosyltransferase [Candidatus Eisenbacteria bacterium]